MIRAIVLFTQKTKTKNQAKRCSPSNVLKVAHVAKTCTTSSVMVYKSSVTSLFFNLSAVSNLESDRSCIRVLFI